MNKIITEFAQRLIKGGYFDVLDQNDKLFYKNSRLRKDNAWYEKCRVAAELLDVERQLEELIDCYCEDTTLHTLLKNKRSIHVSSIPNTKFSLVDFFFCRYLEEQYPHLDVKLTRMVPVDEYHFLDFDKDHLGENVSHQNHPRTKKFVINVAEGNTKGVGHIFICDEKGCWR